MFHLALSHNKKFWHKSQNNIYAGTWMMPDYLKENYLDYNFIIPKWPWDDLDRFIKMFKVWDTYEKFIVKLSEVMNKYIL